MYDVIIIGGGPAGLTAGMYASRAGLKAVLLEALFPGGQLAMATSLENVPGFHEGISGPDFAMQLTEQAMKFGLEIKYDGVTEIDISSDIKKAVTASEVIEGKTIIICAGLSQGKLMVDGEERLTGRGLSNCATCDGTLYKDKITMVAGSGNTAINDVLYLAPLCKKVYLVHRGEKLKGKKDLQEAMFELDNVEVIADSMVSAIHGEDKLEKVTIKGINDHTEKEIDADGLFIAVGTYPSTGFAAGKIELNEKGSIITNSKMETSVEGVFAAGDVRETELKQVITAAADGAVAANSAKQYIIKSRKK